MRQKSGTRKEPAEKVVRDIRRATRKQYSAEENIRTVLTGLRGEDSIAELCRREGIAQSLYYSWSKEFPEAGKKRLAGDMAHEATSDEVKGPGHVHHSAMKLIRIGEMRGGLSNHLEKLAELWRGAGFNVKAFEDIDQLIWEKILCNVTFSAPCTVFDCTAGELMGNPARWNIALGCAQEVYALGRAKGIAFSFEDPAEYVTVFGARMPDARPSMLLDHHARCSSEIDAINGMTLVLGQELGLPTPYNEVLTTIVKTHEAGFANEFSQ